MTEKKIKKVVKGLENCINHGESPTFGCGAKNQCPYEREGVVCWISLNKDALELLKELEAAYQGAEELLRQKTILFDDAMKRLKEQEEQINTQRKNLMILLNEPRIVRCNDCKHGSIYMTEDVCGETLIECNRPDLGDVIEIHGWKWFCADGERRTE